MELQLNKWIHMHRFNVTSIIQDCEGITKNAIKSLKCFLQVTERGFKAQRAQRY